MRITAPSVTVVHSLTVTSLGGGRFVPCANVSLVHSRAVGAMPKNKHVRFGTRFAAALAAVAMLVTGIVVSPAAAKPAGPKPVLPASDAVMHEPKFQWTSVPGATEYELQIALDKDFRKIEFKRVTPATRYLDTTTWAAGSYWWRVRAVEPVRSNYSPARAFTRTWIGPDPSGTPAREIARPDNVRVEDFSDAPGMQAHVNALSVTWDPVPGASYYQVQFDGEPEVTYETPHTAFTPMWEITENCPEHWCEGSHWVRVRAVDMITGTDEDESPLYSLWSDQARSTTAPLPDGGDFDVLGKRAGTKDWAPAAQTGPANGQVFTDMPILAWKPVKDADFYRVMIARDQGFTNIVGEWETANTRLVPLERLREHNAIRSYYWLVLPCVIDKCLNPKYAVNRAGHFRSFKKKTVNVEPTGAVQRGTPWVELTWESHSTTMVREATKNGTLDASRGGLSWYQLQIKPAGSRWKSARTVNTDLTGYLLTNLPYSGNIKWRVRPVDETGAARPWSSIETTNIPQATPLRPRGLRAKREGNRVTLTWNAARARYYPVQHYNVYWSKNAKRWQPLAQVSGRKVEFTMGRKARYWFSVSATNSAGEGAPARTLVR